MSASLPLELHCLHEQLVSGGDCLGVGREGPLIGNHIYELTGQIYVTLFQRSGDHGPPATARSGADSSITGFDGLQPEIVSGAREPLVGAELGDAHLGEGDALAVGVHAVDDAVGGDVQRCQRCRSVAILGLGVDGARRAIL